MRAFETRWRNPRSSRSYGSHMAHGSCARLAIRSRLSDCPSHRHVPYDLYIGITASTTTSVTGHCNFSLLSTQPVTNSSYTDTHEQHKHGRHPSSCSSCQQKKPPVRQASRRENLDPSLVKEPGLSRFSNGTSYMPFDQTGIGCR